MKLQSLKHFAGSCCLGALVALSPQPAALAQTACSLTLPDFPGNAAGLTLSSPWANTGDYSPEVNSGYFSADVTAGNTVVSNGTYIAWCADAATEITDASFTTLLYSSTDPDLNFWLPQGRPASVYVSPEVWHQVNYLLNHKNGAYFWNVQIAIWALVGGPPPQGYLDGGGLPPTDINVVNQLVADAQANAANWVLPCGGTVAAVAVIQDWPSPIQLLILEVPCSCGSTGGGETAFEPGIDMTKIALWPTNIFGGIETYVYTITNSGNVALTNIVVTDDNGTPTFVDDDFLVGVVDRLEVGQVVQFTNSVYLPLQLCGTTCVRSQDKHSRAAKNQPCTKFSFAWGCYSDDRIVKRNVNPWDCAWSASAKSLGCAPTQQPPSAPISNCAPKSKTVTKWTKSRSHINDFLACPPDNNSSPTNSSDNTDAGVLIAQILPTGDYRIIFIEDFDRNDNTYGTNALGWSGAHRFSDLLGAARVTFSFTDATGQQVLKFDMDYLSSVPTSVFPSGYGTLGVTGGNGRMYVGQASSIVTVETSLSANLNSDPFLSNLASYTASSPSLVDTNSAFWEYRMIYEVVVSKNAFGTAGFGGVSVDEIYNVPAKSGPTTFTPSSCGTFFVTNTATVTAQFGDTSVDAQASAVVCSVPPATLGDLVWWDKDKDGIQDCAEPGLAGVVVQLLDNAGNWLSVTTTDASGKYQFTGLLPGGYMLKFILPTGYTFSPSGRGTDRAKDSDANPTTGLTSCISLAADQTDNNWDAGMYPTSSGGGGCP